MENKLNSASSDNLSDLYATIGGAEDDGIIINHDDETQFQNLVVWLVKNADIVPSMARKYSQILLENGIGSVLRLQKKFQKDSQFLNKLGFLEDDVEEITVALHRYQI